MVPPSVSTNAQDILFPPLWGIPHTNHSEALIALEMTAKTWVTRVILAIFSH